MTIDNRRLLKLLKLLKLQGSRKPLTTQHMQ
jgi:hypothetical protein